MARVFITGSSDGLGQLSALWLVKQGHQVVLHARDYSRAKGAWSKVPEAEAIVTGDLSHAEEVKALAAQVNQLGEFDSIIHNAGVYEGDGKQILMVNTLAPYMLTCLIRKPKRLIYLSSGMHKQGTVNLQGIANERISYSDSKLHLLMLAKAISRKWPHVYVNAVDPGWVPTKMGGKNAPDDLQKGCETQAWLAVSEDQSVKVSGRYFFHQQERSYNPLADDVAAQEDLINVLGQRTGIFFR